jgi:phosphorylcholine metabolism protein LicD
MEKKIRIRSKDEIKLRKKAFIEITDLLKKNNLFFFLYGGVLLGFIRDKNFINWDWDVEIGMFRSTFKKNWKQIIKLLVDNDFIIISEDINDLKINFTKYTNKKITTFELNGFRYDFLSGNYIRKKLNIPKKFFDNMEQILIFNRKFKVPKPKKKFLDFFYGQWKTPNRTSKKDIYLTKMIRKDNNWSYYRKIDKIINMCFK